MFKKILLLSAISLATITTTYASTIPYVGASLGITNNTSDLKIINGAQAGGNFRGVPLDVFAGYGGVINQNFYLAGEAFFNLTTPTITSSNGVVKTSYGYGISLNPGVMLTDHTLTYVRLGVVRSRFPSFNNTLTGGQFGLGMQTSLTQNVDIRGEYDYVAYRAQNYVVAGANTSINPRADQFKLGLIYKFD